MCKGQKSKFSHEIPRIKWGGNWVVATYFLRVRVLLIPLLSSPLLSFSPSLLPSQDVLKAPSGESHATIQDPRSPPRPSPPPTTTHQNTPHHPTPLPRVRFPHHPPHPAHPLPRRTARAIRRLSPVAYHKGTRQELRDMAEARGEAKGQLDVLVLRKGRKVDG